MTDVPIYKYNLDDARRENDALRAELSFVKQKLLFATAQLDAWNDWFHRQFDHAPKRPLRAVMEEDMVDEVWRE